jgi:hypothetical protein
VSERKKLLSTPHGENNVSIYDRDGRLLRFPSVFLERLATAAAADVSSSLARSEKHRSNNNNLISFNGKNSHFTASSSTRVLARECST